MPRLGTRRHIFKHVEFNLNKFYSFNSLPLFHFPFSLFASKHKNIITRQLIELNFYGSICPTNT